MLTNRQLIRLDNYISQMSDGDKNKALLTIMFKEYRGYIQYGTPEDFAQCREW